jgi:predicted adenine nucleotide alpha hydrolase (AANH) superfamily ATPase
MTPDAPKKLLLHVCCAPCAPHVIEQLQQEFALTAFFYNPNIHPREEYARRLAEVERYCRERAIALVTGEYDTERWFSAVQGMEEEKEGGRRCEICYRVRLEKTALAAKDHGMSCFASTLTVSPYKKALVINRIGREVGEQCAMSFYEADFKKHDGFKKSCELSRQYNFYRQTYCGCMHSIRD